MKQSGAVFRIEAGKAQTELCTPHWHYVKSSET
jgi:hypothetical protein